MKKSGLAGMNRMEGWLLLELMIALAVLAVGILGFLFSFQSNFKATRELEAQDHAQAALETVVEDLRAADFATLFAKDQSATFPVPGMDAPGGGTASIAVQFFVNETALPAEFASLVDLDGDGKKTNTNVSSNYILLPTRLTLSYQDGSGAQTRTLSFVLGPSR